MATETKPATTNRIANTPTQPMERTRKPLTLQTALQRIIRMVESLPAEDRSRLAGCLASLYPNAISK